jgi:hypothetical protein
MPSPPLLRSRTSTTLCGLRLLRNSADAIATPSMSREDRGLLSMQFRLSARHCRWPCQNAAGAFVLEHLRKITRQSIHPPQAGYQSAANVLCGDFSRACGMRPPNERPTRTARPRLDAQLGQGLGSQNPVIFARQMGQNRRAGALTTA